MRPGWDSPSCLILWEVAGCSGGVGGPSVPGLCLWVPLLIVCSFRHVGLRTREKVFVCPVHRVAQPCAGRSWLWARSLAASGRSPCSGREAGGSSFASTLCAALDQRPTGPSPPWQTGDSATPCWQTAKRCSVRTAGRRCQPRCARPGWKWAVRRNLSVPPAAICLEQRRHN